MPPFIDTEKRLLIIATGGSGAGKTTAGEVIDAVAGEYGIRPYYIDEYGIVVDWFSTNVKRTDLMQTIHSPGDPPEGHKDLTELGYKRLFDDAGDAIIMRVKNNKSARILRTEAARNLKNYTYFHLFSALTRQLGKDTNFANVYLTVSELRVLEQRALTRICSDPTAAPPEIVRMYHKEEHNYPSPVQAAAEFPHFILNGEIHNNKSKSHAENLVRAMFSEAFAAYGRQS